MRIGIIGMGMAGATAAAALARRGCNAEIFEQAPEIREVGAGLWLWPNAIRLLLRLGLGDDLERVGVRAGSPIIRTQTGELRYDLSVATYDDTTGYTIHRADLLDAIAARFPRNWLHVGKRCVKVVESGEDVRLEFADGSSRTFDVVLGADGLRSVAHDAVVAPAPPRFVNLVAYRGLAANTPDIALQRGTVWTDRKKYAIVFPVSAGARINFAGFVPTDGLPEESWMAHGDKAALVAEFAGWDPLLCRIIEALPETFRWGLWNRDPLPRLVSDRVALIGDAGHPLTPHAAQGAGQGIEDAFALAVLLEGCDTKQVPERLKLFQELRMPRTRMVQEVTRRNSQYMHEAFPLRPGEERPDRLGSLQPMIDYDVELETAKLLEAVGAAEG